MMSRVLFRELGVGLVLEVFSLEKVADRDGGVSLGCIGVEVGRIIFLSLTLSLGDLGSLGSIEGLVV